MRGRGLGRVFAVSGDGSYLLTSVLPKPASLAVQSPCLDISMPDLLQGSRAGDAQRLTAQSFFHGFSVPLGNHL